MTPLATTVGESWRRLAAGDRAPRTLTEADIDHYDGLRAMLGRLPMGAPAMAPASGRVRLTDSDTVAVAASTRAAWADDAFVRHLAAAVEEALSQAGWQDNAVDPLRIGCVVGASKGGLRTVEQEWLRCHGGRAAACGSPADAAARADAMSPAAATVAAAALSQAQALQSTPVAACASGLVAILEAARVIQEGRCDVCIAGSSDAGLRASVIAAFHRLRVTSRHDDPPSACRPFDADRDGFVIGEGAAGLVLETRAHAEARGARPLARVTAGGWLNDPAGITQVSTDGTVVAQVTRRTLARLPDDRPVDWANLHGTGTESNDLAEARGLGAVFGNRVPPVTGWKGALGHLLGGAGSVETVLAVESLRRGSVPGTANLTKPDPRCSIPLLRQGERPDRLQRLLKLSLGFGGHVACAVLDAEE